MYWSPQPGSQEGGDPGAQWPQSSPPLLWGKDLGAFCLHSIPQHCGPLLTLFPLPFLMLQRGEVKQETTARFPSPPSKARWEATVYPPNPASLQGDRSGKEKGMCAKEEQGTPPQLAQQKERGNEWALHRARETSRNCHLPS